MGPALRSLLVPGWGQLATGHRRGWAYLAGEAVAWTLHVRWHSKGLDARGAFQDLAWSAASTPGGGARPDPGWAWFETVSHWTRSGAWDLSPADGVQPESDASTYNGMIWQRARDLYLGGDPDAGPGSAGYGDALHYYEERAYGPELLWDWNGREGDLERYRSLIDESDSRLRRATHALGAVLANHVLSGVDAFVSARSGAEVHSRIAPVATGAGTAWTWSVAVAP